MTYAQQHYRPGYTMPSGRQASSREYRERMALLRAREACQECRIARFEAVKNCDWRPGAGICNTHQS